MARVRTNLKSSGPGIGPGARIPRLKPWLQVLVLANILYPWLSLYPSLGSGFLICK